MKKLFAIIMLGVMSMTTLQAKESFNFKQDLARKKNYEVFGVNTYSELNGRLNGRDYLSCFDTVIPKQKALDGDFRVGVWGDSMKDIQRKEKEIELFVTEDNVGGYSQVMGIDMFIGYYFTNDKLTHGIYMCSEEYSDKNKYVEDYEKLKKALTDKYGEPTTDDEVWNEVIYSKDNISDYGMAVATEELKYFTTWDVNNKTRVSLFLTGEGFQTFLTVGYQDLDYAKQQEQQSQEADMDTSGL